MTLPSVGAPAGFHSAMSSVTFTPASAKSSSAGMRSTIVDSVRRYSATVGEKTSAASRIMGICPASSSIQVSICSRTSLGSAA